MFHEKYDHLRERAGQGYNIFVAFQTHTTRLVLRKMTLSFRNRIQGVATKSSVIWSVQMTQTILIFIHIAVAIRSRFRTYRMKSLSLTRQNLNIHCKKYFSFRIFRTHWRTHKIESGLRRKREEHWSCLEIVVVTLLVSISAIWAQEDRSLNLRKNSSDTVHSKVCGWREIHLVCYYFAVYRLAHDWYLIYWHRCEAKLAFLYKINNTNLCII